MSTDREYATFPMRVYPSTGAKLDAACSQVGMGRPQLMQRLVEEALPALVRHLSGPARFVPEIEGWGEDGEC